MVKQTKNTPQAASQEKEGVKVSASKSVFGKDRVAGFGNGRAGQERRSLSEEGGRGD